MYRVKYGFPVRVWIAERAKVEPKCHAFPPCALEVVSSILTPDLGPLPRVPLPHIPTLL